MQKEQLIKFSRIRHDGQIKWVEVQSDNIGLVLLNTPLEPDIITSDEKIDLTNKSIEILPVSEPRTVVGLGWNYKDLVGEKLKYDEPIIFLKSTHSVCGHNSKIELSALHDKVWVEVELVIVISKKTKNVDLENAHNHILGYTIGSDITAENVLNRDWHLARSKAFEKYAPVGPFMVMGMNPNDISLKSRINGKMYQDSTTSYMILGINEIISFVSHHIVLEKGDLIFTGSPKGARDSIVKSGDRVDHIIENIGTLSFNIA